jgi:outer membrane protein W
LPSLGNGSLGIQGAVDVYSWQFGLGYTYFMWPVAVSATYHFNTGDSRFAPFVGAGAGYRFTDCGGPAGIYDSCDEYKGEAYPVARVGARLHVGTSTSLYADGGLGHSPANVGLSWKVK